METDYSSVQNQLFKISVELSIKIEENIMKHEIWSLVGFVLFLMGFIAIILSMVGLDFLPLKPIDSLSKTAGFVCRVLMIFGGLSLLFINRTKQRG